MPTNVVMPQMGESIAEGTIVRWIKKVGDTVDRDEPIFEISTDKVDAEIPAPVGGVITEIRAKEGDTVPVDSIVAVIGEEGEAVAAPEPEQAAATGVQPADTESAPEADAVSAAQVAETPPPTGADAAAAAQTPPPDGAEAELQDDQPLDDEQTPDEDDQPQRTSPVVRRIAREHHVDLRQVHGTGIGGRVTKRDILGYLDRSRPSHPVPPGAQKPPQPPPAKRPQPAPSAPAPVRTLPAPVFRSGDRTEVVPMSIMRRKIAEHMIASQRTSAHVYSVVEADFQKVARLRDAKKAEYEALGVRLTYMAFIARAAVEALRAVPIVNSSVDGDKIVYKKDINVGIAVALDWGLLVPVIRNADEKNLLGLSRAIADLAERARSKKLKPEEVQDGTFTITNPGSLGTLLGMPIINQPQVAILGVGAVEKRPVVIDDAIAIRHRAYLTLGYDHRVIDGAVADRFLSEVKRAIEGFDGEEDQEAGDRR
jgi:2-oxoglutarate dehydrogenase E2 component (dihydrolipoamide succinyltransferase)